MLERRLHLQEDFTRRMFACRMTIGLQRMRKIHDAGNARLDYALQCEIEKTLQLFSCCTRMSERVGGATGSAWT